MKNSIIKSTQPSLIDSGDFKIHVGERDTYGGPAVRKGFADNPSERLDEQLRKGYARDEISKREPPSGVNGEKFESCVHKVKDKNSGVNPWAVCTTSLRRSEMPDFKMVRIGPHADEDEGLDEWKADEAKQKDKADEDFKKRSRAKYKIDDIDLNDSDGRQFHTDGGDKELLELEPEEVDREFADEKRYTFVIDKKSLSEDELFLKACDLPDGVSKKQFDKIANLHENSPEILEKKKAAKSVKKKSVGKSELDELVDLVKSQPQEKQVVKSEEFLRRNSVKPTKQFIKSQGLGGIQFDFGPRTGNPFADNATDLLNQFSDPIQASIAKSQRDQWEGALNSFVAQGERAYSGEARGGNFADPHGALNKGFDQQVKEAHEAGQLEDAPHPQFSKSEITVGGEKVQATSETDAALIEMMKNGNLE